jgi:hypothetical protein
VVVELAVALLLSSVAESPALVGTTPFVQPEVVVGGL